VNTRMSVPRVARVVLTTVLLTTSLSYAADPSPAEYPKLEYVYTAAVTIAPIEQVGATANGMQRIIPITGGTFEGPKIRGSVIPGGADWNLARTDGTAAVEAYYFLRTDDGVIIKIVNKGVLPAAKTGDATRRPALTSPVFEAPKGKYEWLNDGVFVGTLVPRAGGGGVTIRVFKAT
jgi:hypothetical protein